MISRRRLALPFLLAVGACASSTRRSAAPPHSCYRVPLRLDAPGAPGESWLALSDNAERMFFARWFTAFVIAGGRELPARWHGSRAGDMVVTWGSGADSAYAVLRDAHGRVSGVVTYPAASGGPREQAIDAPRVVCALPG